MIPNLNFGAMAAHDTEIKIRAINRRLESYGKHMYHPVFLEDQSETRHLNQYDEIVTRLQSIVEKVPTPVRTLPNGKLSGINIMGHKGNYIQISRSKEVISALTPYINELQTILDQTPTWQDLMKSASQQAGRKLNRKEALKELEQESDIARLSVFKLFLAESEGVFEDTELTELLKPFRSVSKGGTRPANLDKVAQSDIDALETYLYDYRQDLKNNALAGRVITPYMPSSDVDIDDYSRSKGRTKK